jgi:hypothetical protein
MRTRNKAGEGESTLQTGIKEGYKKARLPRSWVYDSP